MKTFRFTNEETGDICRELSYLLHAGIGTADAFYNLAEDETRQPYKTVLNSMAASAENGDTIAECFEKSGCFDSYVSEMLAVGQQSGREENALEAVAASCENRATLDRSVKSALFYPMILLLIMLAVIAVLLIYVLPIFNDVYAQLGSGLTGLAGGLLNAGKALGKISPLLIAVFCLVVAFLAVFAGSDSFRDKIMSAWWRHRGDKGVAGKLNSSRFAQALAMCINSGLPADMAIKEAAKVLTYSGDAGERAEKCSQLMDEGKSIAASLKETGLLPSASCRMFEAGVKGGNSESAINEIANRLTAESDEAIEQSMSRIEPTIVIITSILVGVILLAVMLPLINIMAAIG